MPTAPSERLNRGAELVFESSIPAVRHRGRPLLLVGLGVAGFVLLLLRVPPSSWNVPLIEDSVVFLGGAYSPDPGVIVAPYAGYLQLPLRLVAELVRLFPVGIAAAVIAVASGAVAALLGVALYLFMERRIRSLPLRLLGWLAFVVMPLAGSEMALTLADVQWYLLIAAFWAASVTAATRTVYAVQVVVVTAAVLNNPLALLVIPVIVARIVLLRGGRRELALPILFGAAAVAQIAVVVVTALTAHQRPDTGVARPGLGQFVDFYAGQVALPTLGGVRISTALVARMPTTIAGLALGLLIAALVYLVVRCPPHRRIAVGGFAVASVAFMAVVALLEWKRLSATSVFDFFSSGRYAAVGVALLLGALLLGFDGLQRARRWERWTSLAVAAVIVVVPAILDYRTVDLRAGIRTWDAAVEDAAAVCADGRASAVVESAAPAWWPVPATVPCAVLLGR